MPSLGPVCCEQCYENLSPGVRKGVQDCRCMDILSVPGRSACLFGGLWVPGDGLGPITIPSTPPTVISDQSSNTELAPLKLYYSTERGDNFTTATSEGEQAALGSGYQFARIEGYVFRTQQPGTVPLKLYFNTARGDNYTTATAQGENAAKVHGYFFVRDEGYIYSASQPNTVPLKNYWSAEREDNFTTATTDGEQAALNHGYKFAWVEGYLMSEGGTIRDPREDDKDDKPDDGKPPPLSLVSGVYQVDANNRGTVHRSTWTLEVSGNKISGSSEWQCCPGKRVDPLEGQIDGESVTIVRDCRGQGITVECRQIYSGKIGNGVIQGTFSGVLGSQSDSSPQNVWTLYGK